MTGLEGPGPSGSPRPIKLLREHHVAELIARDPGLRGVVDALARGYLDYHRGNLGLPPGDGWVAVVYPPGNQRAPDAKVLRIESGMVPSVNAAGLHFSAIARAAPGAPSMTILMDFETLGILAFIEDHLLHGVRSGGPTGLAVRYLAKDNATRVGMIGTGRIAGVQLTVTAGARPITSVKAFSRRPEPREAFAHHFRERLGIDVQAVESMEEAVRDVDILLVAPNTPSAPVLDGNLLSPGTLVCSVTSGALDEATCLRGRVVVTARARITGAESPWQPLARMASSGGYDLQRDTSELGEILTGARPGRQDDDEIISFLSPGIGFGDFVVARWLYDLAEQCGVGDVAWQA